MTLAIGALFLFVLLLDVLVLSLSAERGFGFFDFLAFLGFWVLLGCFAHVGLGVDPWAWITHNWQTVLLSFGAYIAIGVGWTFFKWWRYARNAHTKLRTWLDKNPVNPSALSHDRYRHYSSAPGPAKYRDGKFSLQASENKSTIIRWLSLWPFSVLGTLFSDLIVRLWETIYELFSGVYQRISDLVFSDIEVQ